MRVMDEETRDLQDRELQDLARQAQQAPAGSQKRRWALTQLIGYVASIDRLCYPKEQYDLDTDDLSAEARQELFLYICDNINKYDPDRAPFMRWVNFLLQTRFFPQVAKRMREAYSPNPDDTLIGEEEESPYLSQTVEECIQEDATGEFADTHIRGHPQANFRAIALLRLEGKKWKDIADELGVGKSTISDFYQRNLSKFADDIRQSIISRFQL